MLKLVVLLSLASDPLPVDVTSPDGLVEPTGDEGAEGHLYDVGHAPLTDVVAAYSARNKRLRAGLYLSLGVAAVGFISAVLIDRFGIEPKFQNEFKPRQEVLEAFAANTAGDGSGLIGVKQTCFQDAGACRSDAHRLVSDINVMTAAVWVMAGLGALGVAAAVYCFVAGEDPARYAHLVASATPSGGSIGLVGHW